MNTYTVTRKPNNRTETTIMLEHPRVINGNRYDRIINIEQDHNNTYLWATAHHQYYKATLADFTEHLNNAVLQMSVY